MNRLKELREKAGLSLGKLSKELESKKDIKIGRASLSNYERGEQNPRQEIWEQLADYYDVSIPYIMGLSDDREELKDMDLKDLIIKANHAAHNITDPDPDNIVRSKYLTSNIEAFAKIINSAIAADYQKNQEFGNTVMDFLGTVSYLYQNDDYESIASLNDLMFLLTSFGKGIYRGYSFENIREKKTDKGTKYFNDTSTQKEAAENFLEYSEKINHVLNKYFISEFTKKYN